MAAIRSIEELRAVYAQPGERALKKQLTQLDRHCRSFIALSPYLVMCTSDASGNPDASPRGGSPGFCTVVDERTVLIPDRPGNNRLDSFSNLIASGRVGLLFFVPGVDEMLRINGSAELRDDPGLCAQCVEQGKPPKVVISVSVREAYLHCAKAIMRAGLWKPESRVERGVLPSMGQMLRDQIGGDVVQAESQAQMVERYLTQLY